MEVASSVGAGVIVGFGMSVGCGVAVGSSAIGAAGEATAVRRALIVASICSAVSAGTHAVNTSPVKKVPNSFFIIDHLAPKT